MSGINQKHKIKKRILLIQPENQRINRFRKRQFNNFTQITMPYLAAFVDERKYEIVLIDEYNDKIPYDESFDLAAITVNTPNAPHCYRIGEKLREKGAKVVMGGPHAALASEEVKQHCDYLMIGEGEDTWPQFLEDFYDDRPKEVYQPDFPPDLTNLPVPRWDLLKKRNHIMKGAVFASRGCPYYCSYCSLKQIYFGNFRTRPEDQVIDEIKELKSKFFVFWDDNFFADHEYALHLMEKMKKGGLKKQWAAQASLKDCDDDRLLKQAEEAGCLYLFIGLESFSEDSLNDAGKRINPLKEYKRIIEKVHSYGIMIQAGIIFGFDHDDAGVFQRTLNACEKLGIDGVTVSILTPLPKTPIYEKLKAEGRLISEDWSLYDGKTGVAFKPAKMTEKELYDGYLWFRRKFYSLPSFIKRIKVSRTHPLYNLVINLGYRLALPTE